MKKLLILAIAVISLQSCTKEKDSFNVGFEKVKVTELSHEINEIKINRNTNITNK